MALFFLRRTTSATASYSIFAGPRIVALTDREVVGAVVMLTALAVMFLGLRALVRWLGEGADE